MRYVRRIDCWRRASPTSSARGRPATRLTLSRYLTSPQYPPSQQIALAVYKQWETHANLRDTDGFTVSVPHIGQLEGVWKLGAKYSRYPYATNAEKIAASDLSVDHDTSPYGPVVTDGIGWAVCRTVAKLDFGGDHGLYVAQNCTRLLQPQLPQPRRHIPRWRTPGHANHWQYIHHGCRYPRHPILQTKHYLAEWVSPTISLAKEISKCSSRFGSRWRSTALSLDRPILLSSE